MEKYALLGRKLSHSWSQPIHEEYFRLLGISGSYTLIEAEPEELAAVVRRLQQEGFAGCNVTIPYKVDVMHLMDEISPEGTAIGAINTVKFGDELSGCNTDYFGLSQTFSRFGISLAGQNAVILGTGGVSRTVAALCRDKGAGSITFVSRTAKPGVITYDQYEAMPHEGVLINCTPSGMYPDVAACPVKGVAGFSAVVDLIYNPVQTNLLKMAKKAGAVSVNGLYMLVAQAVCAQAIWHDTDVDADMIDKIYAHMLEGAK